MKIGLLKLTYLMLSVMVILITSTMITFLILSMNREDDGKIINRSGKQRVLSQKLTKDCILISSTKDSVEKQTILKKLNGDLEEFQTNYQALIHFHNSDAISDSLKLLKPHFENIERKFRYIMAGKCEKDTIATLLEEESEFLYHMNNIVNLYEKENIKKLKIFRFFIVLSNFLLVLTLVLLTFKIIKPAILEAENSRKVIETKNAELKNLLEIKDKFIAIISHDLKNPFNVIIGFSDLLLQKIESADFSKVLLYSESINTTARNTYDMLENLLHWSFLQQNKVFIQKEKCNVADPVGVVMNELSKFAEMKRIHISYNIPENVVCIADPNMLTIVIRNLVTNALKFTDSEGTVDVSAVNTSHNVEISVKDNGIGMSEEQCKNLFLTREPVSTPGTQGERGTGLGLMLCKEFIEKLDGTIQVESRPNSGTLFKITLPRSSSVD